MSLGIPVKGVWASPEARVVFSPAELDYCVGFYQEAGAHRFIDGIAFAVFEFDPSGRELLLCDKQGRVSLMTLEEVEARATGESIFSQVVRLGEEGGPHFG